MDLERIVKRDIETYLRLRKIYFVRQNAICGSKIGIPDLLVCFNGYFVAVEVKKPGGKESVAQEINGQSITENGGFYIVVDNIDDFKTKLDQIRGF